MKKKGFTLIELLAVIVILAIIMVIAVPKIIDVIESSKKSAAKSSAELYVEAIELKTAMGSLNSNKYPDKDDYLYDEIKVDIKGEGPTSGNYSLKNGKVVSGNFCVNGYEVVFQNRKATVLDKCPEGGVKLSGFIKLSSTSGNYIYPAAGTFEVEENLSGGTLSCTSSDEEVATCSVSGTTVTVTPSEPKTEGGYAVLTIKSAETEKYKEASASYVVTTAAKLSVTANGYEGSYDGQEHGITVTCSDATITYGMTEGIYDLTENPKFIDAGNYTVYYKIEKEGYVTATGNETVIISKLNGNLTLPSESGEVYVGKSITLEVSDATGDITCESSNTSLATCLVSDTTLTINGLSAGTATITISVEENTNYTKLSKIYTLKVNNKVYYNGEVVYYNPVTGVKCSSSSAVSSTGTKTGCLKWHAFNDTDSSMTVNLLLDHNTTALVPWNSSGNNTQGMKEAQTELNKLVSESKWKNTPRLISAYEVAEIIGNTEFNGTYSSPIVKFSGVSWLYNYTYNCSSFGCIYNDNTEYSYGTQSHGIFGYWTSTPVSDNSEFVWRVTRVGELYMSYAYRSDGLISDDGIRPVITVDKSILN